VLQATIILCLEQIQRIRAISFRIPILMTSAGNFLAQLFADFSSLLSG
jgi:hypothetical protein